MRLHKVHVRGLFRQYADLDDSKSPLDGVGDEQVLLRPHLFILKRQKFQWVSSTPL